MVGILAGIRVLDFGRYIAGPYCAALLAEHGAEVIRIEKREGSEDRYVAPVGTGGEGALFLQMNRNKLSLTLAAMHLDYDSLTAVKPDIILTTSSAFGPDGPYGDRVGFDGVGQVMSGAVYMTGEPDRPYRAQVPWVDFGTALHCAFGTMAALMARRETGKGQKVEGALLATALTFTNALLIEQAVIGQPLYRRWAALMGEPHWLEDARFKNDLSRGDHGQVISERMGRWCAGRTTAEALEILGEEKIPAAPVLKPQQTLDHPQVRAMGLFQLIDYPGLKRPAPIAKTPVWLSETSAGICRRAPLLGEHTEQILQQIGYDEAAIGELRRTGVV